MTRTGKLWCTTGLFVIALGLSGCSFLEKLGHPNDSDDCACERKENVIRLS